MPRQIDTALDIGKDIGDMSPILEIIDVRGLDLLCLYPAGFKGEIGNPCGDFQGLNLFHLFYCSRYIFDDLNSVTIYTTFFGTD